MKRRYVLFVVFLVASVASTTAFADAFSFYDSYYSDGTFTTQIGEHDKECDGSISTNWGSTSDFRRRTSTRCINGAVSTFCQQLIDGAWVTVSCGQ